VTDHCAVTHQEEQESGAWSILGKIISWWPWMGLRTGTVTCIQDLCGAAD